LDIAFVATRVLRFVLSKGRKWLPYILTKPVENFVQVSSWQQMNIINATTLFVGACSGEISTEVGAVVTLMIVVGLRSRLEMRTLTFVFIDSLPIFSTYFQKNEVLHFNLFLTKFAWMCGNNVDVRQVTQIRTMRDVGSFRLRSSVSHLLVANRPQPMLYLGLLLKSTLLQYPRWQ
jgi:hypothetical protein